MAYGFDFNLTVDVETPPSAPSNKDSSGGAVVTPRAVRLTGVAGRMVANSGNQQVQFGGRLLEATHMWYTTESDIRNGDVLIMDGRKFRVDGVLKVYGIGSIDTHWRIACNEILFKGAT